MVGLPLPSPNLTILYFPEARGESAKGSEATAQAKPAQTNAPTTSTPAPPAPAPAQPTPAPPVAATPKSGAEENKSYSHFCYALEISQEGGSEPKASGNKGLETPKVKKTDQQNSGDQSGTWRIVARFYLFDLRKTDDPITPTEQPTITLLQRGPSRYGFRPTAVETTEEQLASRFWSELEKIRKGAGINQSLSPGQAHEAEYTRLIGRLLIDRLGRPIGTAEDRQKAYDDLVFEPIAEPMDAWVVWARRLNGGTWWGMIQFLIVLLTVIFLMEFARLALMLWGAGRAIKGKPTPGWIPKDISDAAKQLQAATAGMRGTYREEFRDEIESRMHTARYLVTALPLIGFLGSVAGLSNSLIGSSAVSSPEPTTRQYALQAMQIALGTAFDKSMIAFFASIFCLFLLSLLSAYLDRLSR